MRLSLAVLACVFVPVRSALQSQIAMFSSLPPPELIDKLTASLHYNILTANQPSTSPPKPEILTFDDTTHILVWKFTKEQREYLKTHPSFIGIEADNIVRIAPYNGTLDTPDVEEQGSDAPSLDGSESGQSYNALLNSTQTVTQSDTPNWVS
jgi:hypothetical protein